MTTFIEESDPGSPESSLLSRNRAREAQNDHFEAQGDLREAQNDHLGAPGDLREARKDHLEALRRPPGSPE